MFKAVVPARYASTRLPGKPLLDIAGKPMVVRVAEQARLSKADEVLVATDHPDIASACTEHGIDVVMTRPDWPTGTDRLAEVVQARQWADDTVVVNVQGDEPLIDPDLINLVATTLAHGDQDIATCGHPIFDWSEFKQPNVVKIALKENMEALYFSRAPIPFPRDGFSAEQTTEQQRKSGIGIRHVGLYAYKARFLKTYQNLTPTALEELESLEQLRALAHGFRIKVCIIHESPLPGVDTQADLERVRSLFKTKLG
ncbi:MULTISPECIES: 3-deoxy-manno-octulosonate cytidylyltransferase [Limnobacter]|uniref:3-deoxy-manno-octulosonate cytidylyltransferase n=1 Tax=Limnobacter litoralis TaxID=481366 RepID=A0ABQ5YPE0_9BURK|nr:MULTISPECIES: 3-deoxy-manno-octulosonate cytidylyltransferase [Limnobacter]GLR25979.1 3-deoxy-manno-octulosonate cytidylyltransferase [Limnobacter litoralis]HEX5487156.1 3-deoxy-manno-octulosonate cytidylyltransferase [Limnobacter sp.]